MATVIGAAEARDRFDEIVGRVHDDGETVIIENSSEAMAAVVPVELYQRFMAEREARFAILDRFRNDAPSPANQSSDEMPAPPPDGDEMGGEAPCQLHRFWDAEE
jgi:prevent-host-death family protein